MTTTVEAAAREATTGARPKSREAASLYATSWRSTRTCAASSSAACPSASWSRSSPRPSARAAPRTRSTGTTRSASWKTCWAKHVVDLAADPAGADDAQHDRGPLAASRHRRAGHYQDQHYGLATFTRSARPASSRWRRCGARSAASCGATRSGARTPAPACPARSARSPTRSRTATASSGRWPKASSATRGMKRQRRVCTVRTSWSSSTRRAASPRRRPQPARPAHLRGHADGRHRQPARGQRGQLVRGLVLARRRAHHPDLGARDPELHRREGRPLPVVPARGAPKHTLAKHLVKRSFVEDIRQGVRRGEPVLPGQGARRGSRAAARCASSRPSGRGRRQRRRAGRRAVRGAARPRPADEHYEHMVKRGAWVRLGVDIASDGGDEFVISRAVGDLVTIEHISHRVERTPTP
jgi:hypothetical protein